MAFYIESRPFPTPGGKARPFASRWNPGTPFMANLVANQSRDALQARTSTLNAYFQRQRQARDMTMLPRTQTPVQNPFGINARNIGEYNQGVFEAQFENRRYLGGYPDDYVSQKKVYATSQPGWDNAYGGGQGRYTMSYGKPLYREGAQALFARNLSPDQIRGWQAFFNANGFKTGPAGFWTDFEMNAMKAFMTMANGTPGGGMTVEVLRNRVSADIQAGRLEQGQLATLLGDSGQGGGTEGQIMEPYTETEVEREVTEVGAEEGLALVIDHVRRSVGREPTKAEVAAFVKRLNAAFRADPTVVTTVRTVNPMTGQVDQTRTADETSVSPEGSALEFGKTGVPAEERQGYQSLQFVEALMSELGI